jgi:hypothetical protein
MLVFIAFVFGAGAFLVLVVTAFFFGAGGSLGMGILVVIRLYCYCLYYVLLNIILSNCSLFNYNC